MHAIVCHQHGSPDVMQFEETPTPVPATREVLIESEAIGVNFVDTMRRSGRHPSAPTTPFTPGIEVCGRIVAIGDRVERFQEGDRVIGRCVTHGAYAEFVLTEERFTVSCPEDIPAAEAAALFVNGQTAYHALVSTGKVKSGETVLITAAAGGVGLCAIQIAKTCGAHVVALTGSGDKLSLAEEFGADAAVNYTEAKWPKRVLGYTEGRGADLILESVGGKIANGCLECWVPGGRMVVFGKASGEPAIITTNELLFGNRSVFGLAVGIVLEDETLMREAMDQLFDWHSHDQLRAKVGKTYPLSEAAAAHAALENRQTVGKIVLLP